MNDVKKIVIFLPNWVGDVVMATPTLRAIRAKFPAAKIACLGRPAALATLEGSPDVDEFLLESSKGGLGKFSQTARRVRDFNAELAVLLPNSFRTAALAAWAGCKRRIGYNRDGRGIFLTDKLTVLRDENGKRKPLPTIEYYLQIAQQLGCEITDPAMGLSVRAEDHQTAEALLSQGGYDPDQPLVMLNPGASFGTSKLWLAARYAQAADLLAQSRGAQIIINAAPSDNERKIAATVAAAMKTPPLLNFAELDNTLGGLKALAERCGLLITNDTGTRHIAAAMGISVVTIFGSTDPVWAQIDYPRERIVRVEVPCGPCQKKFCPLDAGGDDFHQCIQKVTVEMVIAAADELLDSNVEGGQ